LFKKRGDWNKNLVQRRRDGRKIRFNAFYSRIEKGNPDADGKEWSKGALQRRVQEV
jgi:hypothetical protein